MPQDAFRVGALADPAGPAFEGVEERDGAVPAREPGGVVEDAVQARAAGTVGEDGVEPGLGALGTGYESALRAASRGGGR